MLKRTLIFAAITALAAPLAACGPYQLTDAERMTAELGARDYADRTQSDYVGCSGQDSEPDGYVTCSVKGRAAPQSQQEIACSYKAGSRGCKRKA